MSVTMTTFPWESKKYQSAKDLAKSGGSERPENLGAALGGSFDEISAKIQGLYESTMKELQTQTSSLNSLKTLLDQFDNKLNASSGKV